MLRKLINTSICFNWIREIGEIAALHQISLIGMKRFLQISFDSVGLERRVSTEREVFPANERGLAASLND